MAIPWDSIRSLVLFFGPVLLPKAISYYRSLRAASAARSAPIQPVPPPIRLALALLGGLALACLVKTLPVFAPENLFLATQSRLQIPVDVLFNRVAAGRPHNILTLVDERLRARFVNLESRLLYFQFGPEVVARCPFCSADEPKSYFYYALPALLWPHIANLVVIAVVTSSSLTGRHGGQWRSLATIGACVIAALDVWLVSSYNYQANARALRLPDIDFFFWDLRVYRLLAVAALDAVLAWLLYLSSTNRAFVEPPSVAQRVDMANRTLLLVRSKLSALGIVKNTALRDEDLRSRSQAYWAHEVRLMSEIMEEREVIEGVNDALGNRIDIQTITRDADSYAQNVLQPLQPASADGS
ncbi:hypothetical protein BGZ61DRAFT_350558 [Ilyonectria robusta]|uniref:uncharacterized protein n=1 Tax=Ilyonectria robusta TaxID=1079257 RepID=UPI001E8ECA81|nr:uncharacterized protein BGZ61DRAFT_350558 [Ilyonectria robusta]KAH8706394.1 hypothetical protein BGZ61DRAFT_350558 [Ilyonectria robusta]